MKFDTIKAINDLQTEENELRDLSVSEFSEIIDFTEKEGYLKISFLDEEGEEYFWEINPKSPKNRDILWDACGLVSTKARWATGEEADYGWLASQLVKAICSLQSNDIALTKAIGGYLPPPPRKKVTLTRIIRPS